MNILQMTSEERHIQWNVFMEWYRSCYSVYTGGRLRYTKGWDYKLWKEIQ